jgi:hypothetical protein
MEDVTILNDQKRYENLNFSFCLQFIHFSLKT